ncbi:MAG: hypothetical protein JST70_14395 [Bacteroidetes bacterium]|nr:hypothetical protein [Bacteroidota bacterium]
MKKNTLKLIALATIALTFNTQSHLFAQAQWIAAPPGTGNTDLITDTKTQNVGIGDNAPSEKLTINGSLGFTSQSSVYREIKAQGYNTGLVLHANNGWGDGAAILMNGNGTAWDQGGIDVLSTVPVTTNEYEPAFRIRNVKTPANGSTWLDPYFIVYKNGKVSIGENVGISTGTNYRLYVKDGILTERIKVALHSDPANWSDFVFADDYNLRPLNEVENYINKHRHLPEIPSTEEVHKEGLDLAQIDAKLLQKIEELTLYVIQQQKEINQLKGKMGK